MIEGYYKPDIEDFYIGYEYEFHGATGGGLCFIDEPEKNIPASVELWGKEVVSTHPFYTRRPYEIEQLLNSNQIRVPYLTREQIEAEGWKITHHEQKPRPYKVNWINATKGNFDLWINLALHESMHLGINANKHIIYRGKCKSINEFRTLMKWLKIS